MTTGASVDPTFEFGLDTFGDVTVGPDGRPRHQAEVIRDVVEEAVLAEQVGVDIIGLGEHHRADFAISSPETVLAAIAGRTERIHLGSAVTVLSSDDPVRVFQRFATLDAVSNGRAEVILGRGSFTESFPLFGYPLDMYEELFEEKLDLFAQLLHEEPVTWSGATRAPLAAPGRLPAHRAPADHVGRRRWEPGVGRARRAPRAAARDRDHRRRERAVRAARRAVPTRAARARQRTTCRSAVHSPGHVGATDEEAMEELWPHWQAMRNRIGAERGWPATTPDEYRHAASPAGALYVGSPETVAAKIAATAPRARPRAVHDEVLGRRRSPTTP